MFEKSALGTSAIEVALVFGLVTSPLAVSTHHATIQTHSNTVTKNINTPALCRTNIYPEGSDLQWRGRVMARDFLCSPQKTKWLHTQTSKTPTPEIVYGMQTIFNSLSKRVNMYEVRFDKQVLSTYGVELEHVQSLRDYLYRREDVGEIRTQLNNTRHNDHKSKPSKHSHSNERQTAFKPVLN